VSPINNITHVLACHRFGVAKPGLRHVDLEVSAQKPVPLFFRGAKTIFYFLFIDLQTVFVEEGARALFAEGV
jgi:hypothetical protein